MLKSVFSDYSDAETLVKGTLEQEQMRQQDKQMKKAHKQFTICVSFTN